MRTRPILAIGLVVLVVGGLVGIGAALLSMAAGAAHHPGARAGTEATHADATPRPSASASPNPTAVQTPSPTPAFRDYVAVGDSFAAGMGGGGETGRCRRSPHGYPMLLAQHEDVTLSRTVACSGATTADVQRDQLAALSKSDDLVTVTIGGNDLDVAGLATACTKGVTRVCQKEFRNSLTLLDVLPDRLAATYSRIVQAAPHARILVTGYPLLFEISQTDSPRFSEIAVVNAATASMNQLIKKAVDTLKSGGARIQYVPISFAGHEIGSSDPWITTSGRDIYHPNAAGYRAMAATLERALR